MKAHPQQPIILDERGTPRFRANQIILYLWKSGLLDLNQIAAMDFSDEDRMQLAQLIGYSVSGYGDLPYAHAGSVADADAKASALLAGEDK
jgi:hypothetical protein